MPVNQILLKSYGDDIGTYDGGVGNDPYYDKVTLHLKASSTILSDLNNDIKGAMDLSKAGQMVSEAPDVNIDTSETKFSDGCFRLDSTDGTLRYMRVKNDNDEGLRFGTGQFTMECWVYINGSNANISNNYRLWQMGQNDTGGYFMGYNASNVYFGRTDESLVSDSRSNWDNGWHHLAIVRGSTHLRMFRDGSQVASTSSGNWNWNNNISDDLYFGLYPANLNSRRNGIRIDDIRFTKGVGRYNSSGYNPPTSPYPQYHQNITNWGTRSRPATNAEQIRTESTGTPPDGTYYIKSGSDVIRTHCEFNSFGGWMMIAAGSGGGSPIPTGNNDGKGTLKAMGSNRGRQSDSIINGMTWNYCWIGMTDNSSEGAYSIHNSGRCSMDPGRQIFSTTGNKFNVGFNTQNSGYSSGSTDNGRNQLWSYKGPGGSSGSSLTSSGRQNGTVINGAGSTDRTINNTNTYGIAPHDAGIGGAWIFNGNGTDGGGNFNNGFDQDYNNVSWQNRYSYWFVK